MRSESTQMKITSGKLVKIPFTVWCYVHGEVHEHKSDPYEDGTRCGPQEWRTLYFRAHKDDS